jgi:Domain of unknown function (DUF4124)
MTRIKFFLALSIFFCGSASADIWAWVDANGEKHFVSTQTPIYTWVEDDKVFYSDAPDHEDAVLVQLIWHSKGTLKESAAADESALAAGESVNGDADPGETPEERAERVAAEAHHCKRVTEIYKSYENAPRLYRTSAKGEREYLSAKEAKATMEDAKTKMDLACK